MEHSLVTPTCGADTEHAELKSQDQSPIWQYTRPHSPSRPERCIKKRKIWYCGPCWSDKRRDTHYKLYAGTQSAIKHLRLHGHYVDPKDPKHTNSTQKKLTDQVYWTDLSTMNPRKPQTKFPKFDPADLNAVTLRSVYTDLVVQKNLPLDLCQAPELRALLSYANPYANKILPTSHSTIRADIKLEYINKQVLIKQALQQSISKIHFSVDCWTSPNQIGILGIIVHFVIDQLGLQHLLLALQEIDGGHTGEALEMEIIALFKEYGILDKIGYMMGDNASNNDTCGTWIDQELEDIGINWKHAKYRVRCIGHIINLSVQAFLRGLRKDFDFNKSLESDTTDKDRFRESAEVKRWRQLGPLGKLRNMVTYILASPQRRQIWKEYSGGKFLKKHNATR